MAMRMPMRPRKPSMAEEAMEAETPMPAQAGEAAESYEEGGAGQTKAGAGVEMVGDNGEGEETNCLMRFPLTGSFWGRPPKHGQA